MIQWRYGLLLALLLPALSWGQVALDSTTTCTTGSTLQATCASSVPVATSTDRYLHVGVCVRSGTVTTSTLTYGAQALALVERIVDATNGLTGEVWGLTAPAEGTALLTATFSATARATWAAQVFNGVDQTTPRRTVQESQNTSATTSASHAITTQADDLVIDSLCVRALGGISNVQAGASQTQHFTVATSDASANVTGVGSTELATGTSTTMSWAWTAFDRNSLMSVALAPSGGGGGAAPAETAVAYFDGQLTTACLGTYSITSRDCSGPDTDAVNGYPTALACVQAMAAGTTCRGRAGQYSERISNALPSGLSNTQRTRMDAHPGEERQVEFLCPDTSNSALFALGQKQYITLENFIINGETALEIPNQGCVTITLTSSEFIHLRGMQIERSRHMGITMFNAGESGTVQGHSNLVEDTVLQDNGRWWPTELDGGHPHAAYVSTAYNVFRGVTMRRQGGFGWHPYRSSSGGGNTGNIGERILSYENGIGASTSACTMTLGSTSGNLLSNSVLIGVGEDCGLLMVSGGNTAHNTLIYGHSANGVTNGHSSAVFANMLVTQNSPNYAGGSLGVQIASTQNTPAFVDAPNRDFNLLSTDVTALGQGAVLSPCPSTPGGTVSCAFKGAAPNIGPFQDQRPGTDWAPQRIMADATSLLLTVDLLYPPADNCDPAAFTVTGSTTGASAVTTCTPTASGLDLTTSATFVNGETITVSWTYNAFSDSMNIGASWDAANLDQRVRAVTAAAVVNQIGEAPSTAVLTQTACAWYEPSGTEAGALPLAGGAATAAIPVSGGAVLRCKLAGTVADPDSFTPRLFCRNNAAAYAAASTTCTSTGLCVNLGLAPQLAHGQATTERLASQHATNVAGTVSGTGTFALWDPVQDSEGEFVTAVQVGAQASGTFDCRLEHADGTDLDGYTTLGNGLAAPRLTVTGGGIAGTTIRLYGLQGQ